MSALIATLRDDFADNSTAAAWGAIASGSATVAETGAQARFTLPSSTAGTHIARYTSAALYDLTGGSFYINIETMVATGVAATALFQFYIDTSNALQWIQVSGTIYARKLVAGVLTDLYSAAWSGTTYKYLRISESGGTISWHSSTNGTSWTSRATLANPFAITDLLVDFGVSCGNVASPGSFRLDDVNLILPALTTNWRWTQIVWPLANRYKVVTLALDTVGTAQGYVVTADGVDVNGDPSGNVRYWAGTAHDGRLLTEQASDAAAKAMAVNIPADGRFDLPTIIEARVIRVYHRSIDGSAYTLREVYPRRLVQTDDIEAEAIRALHIAAGSITADRLDVDQLSAITADCGTLTAGTIDGVAGYFGSGNEVTLDDSGVTILAAASSPWDPQNSLDWVDNVAVRIGSVRAVYTGGANNLYIEATSGSSRPGAVTISADSTLDSSLTLQASVALGTAQAYLTADLVEVRSNDTGATNGINLYGSAGASTPEFSVTNNNVVVNAPMVSNTISALALTAATNTTATVLALRHNSSATPTTNFGTTLLLQAESSTTEDRSIAQLTARWATATDASRKGQLVFFVYDTAIRAALTLEANGSAAMAGFLGAAAVARPNVTGSRATDTWRQNLMTALANLGLVTDSSTA